MEIEPREVFDHFAAITAIPRGSGKEAAVGDYLMEFAASHGLAAIRDQVGNVIIRKPCGPGGDGGAPVVVQAHMDMVQESNVPFNFREKGPALIRDGDWLRADHTTLGADNGIGMAYAMALLASDNIPHPALEVVFTVAEETGMHGAKGLDISLLAGNRLINLDSEEEGVLYVSCAGGVRMTLVLPVAWVPVAELPRIANLAAYRVEVAGLKGGHSGAEIDKERGNSNHLLARVLAGVAPCLPFHLAEIEGGQVDNAIPARSAAVALWEKDREESVRDLVAEWNTVFKRELAATDPGVGVRLVPAPMPSSVMGLEDQNRVIAAMMTLPHGVEAMDMSLQGERLVETSRNFALVRTGGKAVRCTLSLRSSVDSKLGYLEQEIRVLAGLLGAEVEMGESYPGWEFSPDSELRKVFTGMRCKGIHAGLECGVFAQKYRQAGRRLDMVSFGPDIRDAHTPEERVNIPSTGRVWEALKEAMRTLSTMS